MDLKTYFIQEEHEWQFEGVWQSPQQSIKNAGTLKRNSTLLSPSLCFSSSPGNPAKWSDGPPHDEQFVRLERYVVPRRQNCNSGKNEIIVEKERDERAAAADSGWSLGWETQRGRPMICWGRSTISDLWVNTILVFWSAFDLKDHPVL